MENIKEVLDRIELSEREIKKLEWSDKDVAEYKRDINTISKHVKDAVEFAIQFLSNIADYEFSAGLEISKKMYSATEIKDRLNFYGSYQNHLRRHAFVYDLIELLNMCPEPESKESETDK